MASGEYLFIEPRKRGEDPFYVRVLAADEHHPSVDGNRAAFEVCNATGEGLSEWKSEKQLRHEARKISRAILHDGKPVLVPV